MKKVIETFVLVLLTISQLPSVKPSNQDDLTAAFNFVINLESGLKVAKMESKPVLLFAHMSGCGACDRLIAKLVKSVNVKKLSQDFVMVNAFETKDSLAQDVRYRPDGKYFPRIVFIGSNGEILNITNPNQPKYNYYYTTSEEVCTSMKKAVELNSLTTPSNHNDLTTAFNFVLNLESGLKISKNELKPVMLLAHWSQCGACARLIPRLIESVDVRKLSQDFVMVNDFDMQDSLAQDVKYRPDGNYFPRIIFIGSNGEILKVTNPEQPEYNYYYTTSEEVCTSMKKAAELNKKMK